MRAYDMAMVLIFVNCAFALIAGMAPQLDILGSDATSGFGTLTVWFTGTWFTIAGIEITTMTALALAFAGGTIVVLNSNPVTDKGLASIAFTAVFWGSWGTTSLIISNLLNKYDVGIGIFFVIFFIASTLIFINALVQLSTGGQQTHV